MTVAGSTNWMSLGGNGFQSANQGGGGIPVARDTLDERRMGLPRTPQAEYPDGYLGSIRSRRDDRLLDSLKARVGQKSYQRGVHKGERVDVSAYLWPPELRPDRGLANIAKGVHTGPIVTMTPPPHLVNDGKSNMRSDAPGQIDPRKQALLASMRPAWR